MKPPAPVTNTLRRCGIQTFLRSKVVYCIHYVFLLLEGELRIERKSKSFSSSLLRLRERARFVAEVCEAFLQVQRYGIVNLGRDIACLQVVHHRIAMLGNANYVLMKDVAPVSSDEWRIESEVELRSLEQARINFCLLCTRV